MHLGDRIAEDLARMARESNFSGVVFLSHLDDGPSTDLAFGLADRGHHVPNHLETRFAMASGSKIFTAVAIGLLMQEGKIQPDTRLSDCIPSREFHFDSGITIGQLLNHTSGVPDYFDEENHSSFAELWNEHSCYRMTSIRDFLPLFEKKPMQASPGKAFLYSNSGYLLLGLVIEELAGCDFRDFIKEHIFRPCAMNQTGYFAMDALPENTALSYLSSEKSDPRTNIFSLPSIGGPDGGAYTTAGDLRLFWIAFLTGRLLPPKWVDLFLAPSIRVDESDESRHYGYGLWLRKSGDHWIVSILGHDPGVSMVSRVRLRDGLIMTILSNVQNGTRALSRWLDEKINEP